MNAPATRIHVPVYVPDPMEVDGQLISHNIWVDGHRTSVRLEAVMWQSLHEIATREGLSLHDLITLISQRRHSQASLTATIRAFLVAYYRSLSVGGGNDSRLLASQRSPLPLSRTMSGKV